MISFVDLGRYLSTHISFSTSNLLPSVECCVAVLLTGSVCVKVFALVGGSVRAFLALLSSVEREDTEDVDGPDFGCLGGNECIRARNLSSSSDTVLNCFIWNEKGKL